MSSGMGRVFSNFEASVSIWFKNLAAGHKEHKSGNSIVDYLANLQKSDTSRIRDETLVTRLFTGALLNRAWRLQHTYIVKAEVSSGQCQIDTCGNAMVKVCVRDEPNRVFYVQRISDKLCLDETHGDGNISRRSLDSRCLSGTRCWIWNKIGGHCQVSDLLPHCGILFSHDKLYLHANPLPVGHH